MPLAPSLCGGLIWCPTTIYTHAFEFCPSLPLTCPSRLRAGQFGLAGGGSMIAMPRSMRGRTITGKPKWHASRQLAWNSRFSTWFTKTDRCVPIAECRAMSSGGLDGDAAARAVIEEQDRIIAEKSGTPAVGVKSIHRSGSKNIDRAVRPPDVN